MNRRMYGLFERQNGKWVRLYPDVCAPKKTAIVLFQGALLAGALGTCNERALKPIGQLRY